MAMKSKNKLIIVLAALLIFAGVPALSFAAVTYFADCAWNPDGSDLVCHIYADTDADDVISGGIKLSYDTDKLSDPVAVKNEDVWYFGTAEGTKYAYMEPEVDPDAGTIIYIVGKLDEDNPTEGVAGSRVVIGTVTFSRTDTGDPCGGSDPDPVGYFGIDLMLGRDGNYENFVSTAGDLLDAASSKGLIQAAERGDANADCSINAVDYIGVRNNSAVENPPPYADCNADGAVNAVDYICVRNASS
jgi:hypothetical protein